MTLRELREVRVLRRMPVPVEFLSEFSATYGDLFLHAAVFTNTLGKSSSRSSTAALMTAWHVPVAEAVERVFAAEDRGKDGRCTSCRRAVTQGHVAARRSENGSMARIASKSPALA